MLKRWEPAEIGEPDGTGDECEAFLAGEWAEYLAAHHERVPHWAWLNRVAHVSETAVRLAVRAQVYGHRALDDWTRLQLCLAQALVEQSSARGIPLHELQRSVLVPIELSLFAGDGPSRLEDPDLLVRILAALRHPSGQPGSF